jgi:tetratricopeptide (TPR) repeat protein
MRLRNLIPLLLVALTACDELLDVQPVDETPDTEAITDAASAQAALVGAYAALAGGSYYGGDILFMNDLLADNAVHTGTLHSLAEADLLEVRADNGTVSGMWSQLYEAINRVNVILRDVPNVPGITAGTRARILGEAYFLRALHYHHLVRLWGDVPLVLTPPATVEEASAVTRAPAAEVYAQILEDLDAAAAAVPAAGPATRATRGAVEALRARVLLQLGDWAGAEAAAEAVQGMGYALVEDFGDLFDPEGAPTPEDIFRTVFTPADYNVIGYYYISAACGGGRGEVALDPDLVDAFEAGDERADWTVLAVDAELCGAKDPTTIGAEDVHVIRYAEVLLILAEALARQGRLQEAVDVYNEVRVRAGLAEHELGTDVTTEEDVLAAIWQERRVELAQEGDRWSDLLRTGRAEEVLGAEPCSLLLPIPQGELDVAPNLEPNPVCG